MIRTAVRGLLATPAPPDPPVRVRRDWVLVGALVLSAVLEGAFRADVAWRPLVTVIAVGLAVTLLWRRTHPLAVVSGAVALIIAMDVASLVQGLEQTPGLYTMVFVVLLPYALFRWGSGRDVALGTALLLTMFGIAMAADWTTFGEAVAGFVFFWFPGALGATVRFWTTSRTREVEQLRLREREQLARELHDTVAHHVSAMVIRAQAGRVTATAAAGRGAEPGAGLAAAVQALETIEEEGARTLEQMRAMVGTLRDGGARAELAPVGGLADLPRLAAAAGRLRVDIGVDEGVGMLPPALDAAVYRIAQESVTNAMRHARGATRVDVAVVAEPGTVRLTVADDGRPVVPAPEGFGITGMRERASLLGGALQAGPGAQGGWQVSAVLPRGRAGTVGG